MLYLPLAEPVDSFAVKAAMPGKIYENKFIDLLMEPERALFRLGYEEKIRSAITKFLFFRALPHAQRPWLRHKRDAFEPTGRKNEKTDPKATSGQDSGDKWLRLPAEKKHIEDVPVSRPSQRGCSFVTAPRETICSPVTRSL